MVGGSTKIPEIISMVKSFFNGKEIISSIDPNLVVSIGASIYAGVKFGHSQEKNQGCGLVLMDKLSHSLGIEIEGGTMVKIIHKNSNLPTEKFPKTFSTLKDN